MQTLVTGGMKAKVFELIINNNGTMKETDIIDELWFNGDSTGVNAKDFKKAKNNLASQITYLRKSLKDHGGTVSKENGIIKIDFVTISPPKPVIPMNDGEVECVSCGAIFETEETHEDPHCLTCVNNLMTELGISFV